MESTNIKMEYDKDADAAYINLAQKPEFSANQQIISTKSGEIVLDFNENNQLVGIELISVSKILSKDLIDRIK